MRRHGVSSLRQVQQTVPRLDRCQDLFDPQVFLHMCGVVIKEAVSSSPPAVHLLYANVSILLVRSHLHI